jgi:hypothetical protein
MQTAAARKEETDRKPELFSIDMDMDRIGEWLG